MLQWLLKFVRRQELSSPLPHSKPLQDFCSAFDAHPEKSNRRFHRRSKIDWADYSDPNIYYKAEEVEAVAIHIPIYKLDEFLSSIPSQRYKEMEIRAQVPAVKLAYERYQMLLKMCGGDYDAGY
jgi:hypothetical protein